MVTRQTPKTLELKITSGKKKHRTATIGPFPLVKLKTRESSASRVDSRVSAGSARRARQYLLRFPGTASSKESDPIRKGVSTLGKSIPTHVVGTA